MVDVKCFKPILVIKCKTDEFPGECPSSAQCKQLVVNITISTTKPTNTYDGLCTCKDDIAYEFNNQYRNFTDYCVINIHSKQPTVGDVSEGMTVAAEASQQLVPSSHHIVGGILISICVVLVFFIGIIGYRKLQITQRLRNLRIPSGAGGRNSRQRRSRPFYEDVMMSNDNDDPPLI